MAINITILPDSSLATVSLERVSMPERVIYPDDYFTAVVPKVSNLHPRWRVLRYRAHVKATGYFSGESDFWLTPQDGPNPTPQEAADAQFADHRATYPAFGTTVFEVTEIALELEHVDGVGLLRTEDGLSLISSGDRLVRAD